MKLYYSISFLAAISLTASAYGTDSLSLATTIATAITGGGVPSTVIQENSRGTNSPNSKSSHGGDYKPANKANPEDPTGYSPTYSGGGGATNISYTFGSPTGSGSTGPKNINIELPFPGANSDSTGGSTASGASRALANATGSSAVGASAVGTGISSPQSGSNVANGAQAVSNGISNYGAQSGQGANTQTTSQNSGSQTPTLQTLLKTGPNNLPIIAVPKTPISGSFESNMANQGVTTNIPTNIGNLVGNSSPNLFASILPGDSSGGNSSSSKTKDTFTDAVQSAPSTNNYSTPLIIASNSPSQEAPVTATNPTSSSPTSTTPSSTSSTTSSTTTAGTSTTSTPASSATTTNGATPSATTTSASNAGTTPSASGTPASTTHSGGATAAVAPTTGTPVVTASTTTTAAPESTTSGANLSSTGGGGATSAPDSQGSSPGGLRLFDSDLPPPISYKTHIEMGGVTTASIGSSSPISDSAAAVAKDKCDKNFNSYLHSSTFTRSIDPTRNSILKCIENDPYTLTERNKFYSQLEEYYKKECSKIKDIPDFKKLMSFVDLDHANIEPRTPPLDYPEKLKELKNKYSPNYEPGQLYINRCANMYRLLETYKKYKKVNESYINEDSNIKKSVLPHSSTVSPVKVSTPPEASDD